MTVGDMSCPRETARGDRQRERVRGGPGLPQVSTDWKTPVCAHSRNQAKTWSPEGRGRERLTHSSTASPTGRPSARAESRRYDGRVSGSR